MLPQMTFHFFWWLTSFPLFVRTTSSLSIHLLMDLQVVNCGWCCCDHRRAGVFSHHSCPDTCPGVGLLGHTPAPFSVPEEPPCCFRASVGPLHVSCGGMSAYCFCWVFSWAVFCCWTVWAVCLSVCLCVWKLSPCWPRRLWCFLWVRRWSLHFVYHFLCCAKAYKFDYVPFVYFCFYFYCLGRLT